MADQEQLHGGRRSPPVLSFTAVCSCGAVADVGRPIVLRVNGRERVTWTLPQGWRQGEDGPVCGECGEAKESC